MLTLSKPPPVELRTPAFTVGPDWPPRSTDLLAKVDRLLRDGRPREAADVIGDAYLSCPWTANALAVCHLRLGNTARAVRLLRYIATDHASSELRADVPMVFKTNLATALLADGDAGGFLSTLDRLGGDDHPSGQRLRATAARWKESLTAWQKFWWNVGGFTPRPPRLDSPLGELWAPPAGDQAPTSHPRNGRPLPEAEVIATTEGPSATGVAFAPLSRTGVV